ncbi:MAG TPA: TraB/GumN family protein, partial [Bacteroidia bacterium]|nr:TraB/GumN family protein [Bacteroidia bacterium]
MKKILLLAFISFSLFANAQQKEKKYQSLMWEITGNGLAKPSYLYGTMHVPDKLAFHLGDTFFMGIQNVDMVALEINPETWVDDMLAYDPYTFWGDNMFYSNWGRNNKDDKEKERNEAIAAALRSDPSLINYYLYRSQGYTGNFEERTYLDLYIFQTGKKLGKQVAGLEKMDELMLMLEEAERARNEEYKYKENDYNYDYDEDYMSFGEILEDAYRRGDLDMLDSLNIADGTPGYLEYMLYRRNQNMADRMDTIMRQ